MTRSNYGPIGAIALVVAASAMLAAPGDARGRSSFGSRGARTYSAPAPTALTPRPVAPVQRTMTQGQRPGQSGAFAQNRPASRFGGMARGLIGGLIAGGLIAALLGGGFGALGGSGLIMALLQVAIVAGLAMFAIRWFRRRSATAGAGYAPAMSAGAAPGGFGGGRSPFAAAPFAGPFAGGGSGFGGSAPARAPEFAAVPQQDIMIEQSDKEAFERLLADVQLSFGREDYAALRTHTTPEIMSYFAEELGQNAANGQRNEITGTRLLDADVAEAWSEGHTDYATIAMRYENIDVMRDRATGALVSGDANVPVQVTEIWTFSRAGDGPWRLSAVQDV
jgi:predicted lipid-binding transport protein (Tim44 family)